MRKITTFVQHGQIMLNKKRFEVIRYQVRYLLHIGTFL